MPSAGETVHVTTLTGGNPDLDADRRNVLKVGGNWRPFEKTDLRLRAEYVRQSIDDPQASFPAATPALEAAFPRSLCPRRRAAIWSRVDLRPVNFRQFIAAIPFRWGFDFTKPLHSKRPSQAQIAAFRQRAAQQGAGGGAAPTSPPVASPPPDAGGAPAGPGGADAGPGGRGFGGGRGGGGGGVGGGRTGGRLTLSADPHAQP